jgi:Flp pilus assembly secretin CpaC
MIRALAVIAAVSSPTPAPTSTSVDPHAPLTCRASLFDVRSDIKDRASARVSVENAARSLTRIRSMLQRGDAFAAGSPSLVVLSGQPVTFMRGGEVPRTERDGTVTYVDSGIALGLTVTRESDGTFRKPRT